MDVNVFPDFLNLRVYYAAAGQSFSEDGAIGLRLRLTEARQWCSIPIFATAAIDRVRLDFSDRPSRFVLHEMELESCHGEMVFRWDQTIALLNEGKDVEAAPAPRGAIVTMLGDDAQLELPCSGDHASLVLRLCITAVAGHGAPGNPQDGGSELVTALLETRRATRGMVDQLIFLQEESARDVAAVRADVRKVDATLVDLAGRLDALSGQAIAEREGLIGPLAKLTAELGELRGEVGAQRPDIGAIRTSVDAHRTDLGAIRADVEAQCTDFGAVLAGLDAQQNRLDHTLAERTDALPDMLKDLRDAVTALPAVQARDTGGKIDEAVERILAAMAKTAAGLRGSTRERDQDHDQLLAAIRSIDLALDELGGRLGGRIDALQGGVAGIVGSQAERLTASLLSAIDASSARGIDDVKATHVMLEQLGAQTRARLTLGFESLPSQLDQLAETLSDRMRGHLNATLASPENERLRAELRATEQRAEDRIASADTAVTAASAHAARLENELAIVLARLDRLKRSWSWRLTSPIRWTADAKEGRR